MSCGFCQVIKPGGPRVGETSRLLKFIETGDPLTTNIAFGGDELDTAFITVRLRAATALRLIKDSQLRVADRAGVRAQVSGTGRLLKMPWHCKGHRCRYEEDVSPSAVTSSPAPKL